MKDVWKWITGVLGVGVGVLAAWFSYQLITLGMVPNKILAMIVVIVVLLWLIALVLMLRVQSVLSRVLGVVLALALALATGFGTYYLQVTNGALRSLTYGDQIRKISSVYVLNNHVITKPDALNGRTIGYVNPEAEGTKHVLDGLQEKGIEVVGKQYESSIQMVNDLKGQAIDGIVLDQSYLGTIEEMEGQDRIREEIVPVFDVEYAIQKTDSSSGVNTANESFNVLISGIDTYGSIEDVSRSDVNLIASVNPQTHQILVISIPRDFYVETACDASAGCAQGKMDKLTHTGLHGIETTERTLEKLFGIEINYNVRVNFSSLVTIIDELGGVDVDNVDEFTSLYKGYVFKPGRVHVDGDMALGFVRERYSFTEGDRERGRNQMRVLTAIIDKITSPAILSNYAGIMKSISKSFQTNMSTKEIAALVNAQLSSDAPWTIYNYSVNGTGGTDFAYELQNNAYVMYPNEMTISNAKADIDSIFHGETPPYVNH